MENLNPYLLMLIALGVLAIIDLVVGVSNDAVNFLNSAIGSKAFSVKKILVIASLGVFFGAVSSSGMMEVARKGIFHPNMFVFEEIMYIFMAVMITDILLLDIFNSLGMPTSTTVSIVFELLGAAVAIALLKIAANDAVNLSQITEYINTATALKIVLGILLSVVVAFTIGALVQFVSRLLYTFDFKSRPNYVNVIFGGFAFTSIAFFIVFKGFKGTPYYAEIKGLLEGMTIVILLGSFVFNTLLSYILIKVFKINVLYPIIGLGVFALAVAFSGNDLVNFIGVPMAALNSYEAWKGSGVLASEFSMDILDKKVPSNVYLLLLAGAIMVVTLWTSKKSKAVIETEVNLSRQGDGAERFEANALSRAIVKFAIKSNNAFSSLFPSKTLELVNSKFQKPVIQVSKADRPAFDLVRAAVNLVVSGILISLATSMKLPLSTTYVSFMVAMGTSLADRAWGRDSAVYRVAGVLNVIGGWFLTAIIAFSAAATVAFFISWTQVMIPIFLVLVLGMLVRSTILHAKKQKEKALEEQTTSAEIKTINEIINESNKHISKVAKRVNKLYSNVVQGLDKEDLKSLKKNDKLVLKLNKDIDSLKDGVFYFIKALDDNSVKASKFYILTLSLLTDIAQSIQDISKSSFKHVNNNHLCLKKSQIKDLKYIDNAFSLTLNEVSIAFEDIDNSDKLQSIIKSKKSLLAEVNDSIELQISRVSKTEESSPKNTTLYFGILLETQALMNLFLDLIEMHEEFKLLTKNS